VLNDLGLKDFMHHTPRHGRPSGEPVQGHSSFQRSLELRLNPLKLTNSLTFTILRSTHTVYLCVLCGSENKQRLSPYTALNDLFLSPRRTKFTSRYGLSLQIQLTVIKGSDCSIRTPVGNLSLRNQIKLRNADMVHRFLWTRGRRIAETNKILDVLNVGCFKKLRKIHFQKS